MLASSLSEAAIETYVQQVVIANYIHVSATAVLVYDTIVTLDREVAQVWKGGSVWFAVLYCANRYCAILNRLLVVLERMQWKGQTIQKSFGTYSCGVISWLDPVLLVITWFAIATFSALRVYALSGKRLWLLLVVLCLGLVLPVADLYQQTTITPFILPSPLAGCNGTSNMSLDAYRLGDRCTSLVDRIRSHRFAGHTSPDVPHLSNEQPGQRPCSKPRTLRGRLVILCRAFPLQSLRHSVSANIC
ncbi:hypothetical protein GY45DRAFT_558000 [Cubamyces sp. BRFM 1775]|nr:hypothetical protein GY45DRAFT_558000 [Cubamyces sp. BRFM 1775]